MTKQVGLWLMIGGAAVSLWDYMSGNSLYGPGKPLAGMSFKTFTAGNRTWYVSVSDAAAIAGAVIYFKR